MSRKVINQPSSICTTGQCSSRLISTSPHCYSDERLYPSILALDRISNWRRISSLFKSQWRLILEGMDRKLEPAAPFYATWNLQIQTFANRGNPCPSPEKGIYGNLLALSCPDVVPRWFPPWRWGRWVVDS